MSNSGPKKDETNVVRECLAMPFGVSFCYDRVVAESKASAGERAVRECYSMPLGSPACFASFDYPNTGRSHKP